MSTLKFTHHHPSLTYWTIPAQTYLTQNNKPYDGLATAIAVFNPQNQILLLQRSATDSNPLKWELPGGAVDASDETILHGAARELFEESGLTVTRFVCLVREGRDGREEAVFSSRSGKQICRFTFLAEVEGWEGVRLDANEHADFAWVGEGEVRGRRIGGWEVEITSESVAETILEAFRVRREGLGNG